MLRKDHRARRLLCTTILGLTLGAVPMSAARADIVLNVQDSFPQYQGSDAEYHSASGLVISFLASGDTITSSPDPMPLGLTSGSLTLSSLSLDHAFASASLEQGVVRAQANTGPLSSYFAASTAILQDTVVFHILGGAPTSLVDVHVHLDGTEVGAGLNAGSYAASVPFGLGGTFDYYSSISNNGNSGFGFAGASGYGPPSGWQSYTITNASLTGFDFDGILSVYDGYSPGLSFQLGLSCFGPAQCDFSHTGSVSLGLPNNVTFTSASGAFLTESGAGSVPEPATWAMMLMGFGVLGAALRAARRRRWSQDSATPITP